MGNKSQGDFCQGSPEGDTESSPCQRAKLPSPALRGRLAVPLLQAPLPPPAIPMLQPPGAPITLGAFRPCPPVSHPPPPTSQSQNPLEGLRDPGRAPPRALPVLLLPPGWDSSLHSIEFCNKSLGRDGLPWNQTHLEHRLTRTGPLSHHLVSTVLSHSDPTAHNGSDVLKPFNSL